jgi:poly(3-hydroxybutyrate) depolymerase
MLIRSELPARHQRVKFARVRASVARDSHYDAAPDRPPNGAQEIWNRDLMVHGCTQDPDDFAAGTRMNEAARSRGCVVLYPAQSKQANPQRCWNWFKRSHQQRGRGEPALLAAMTRHLVDRHEIDPARVYEEMLRFFLEHPRV